MWNGTGSHQPATSLTQWCCGPWRLDTLILPRLLSATWFRREDKLWLATPALLDREESWLRESLTDASLHTIWTGLHLVWWLYPPSASLCFSGTPARGNMIRPRARRTETSLLCSRMGLGVGREIKGFCEKHCPYSGWKLKLGDQWTWFRFDRTEYLRELWSKK